MDNINSFLPDGDMSGIILMNCNWKVKTAGPSPFNNERVELFFMGCKKALNGNPCKGCFNSQTWDSSIAKFSHDPVLMAKHINNCAPHKYITIGGGEPLDQIDNLIILCKELKKYGFHIMVYSWRRLQTMLDMTPIYTLPGYEIEYIGRHKTEELLKYIDMFVDGEYHQDERLWNGNAEDGLISSVGSGNQIIWDINNRKGYAMRDIDSLILTSNNFLIYTLKNNAKELKF